MGTGSSNPLTLDKVDWESLSSESAKFVLEEAEKNLIEHIETSKAHTARAQALIGTFTPLLVGLITFVADQHFKHHEPVLMNFYIPIVLCVPMIAIIIVSIDVYWLHDLSVTGNEPRLMLRDEIIKSPKQ